jgi:sugar phosphate isomerase/epimerase
LILGEGTFDFAGFKSHLREVEYNGFLTAELAWHYTLNPQPTAGQTAGIMRTLI